MHDLKRISDIALNLRRELGRKARHMSSAAMVAITTCGEFALRCDFGIV
jgi:hypothetical protein